MILFSSLQFDTRPLASSRVRCGASHLFTFLIEMLPLLCWERIAELYLNTPSMIVGGDAVGAKRWSLGCWIIRSSLAT